MTGEINRLGDAGLLARQDGGGCAILDEQHDLGSVAGILGGELDDAADIGVGTHNPFFPDSKGFDLDNLDFYLTVCVRMLGFPRAMPAAIFAIGRASGWIAHALEQYADNRLIRPRADYIGPAYPQKYIPMGQR